jgi:Rrf2 family nitric oxide-sensitive transcriptional repressor
MLNGRCQLTAIVSGALQSFMQYLDRYTLADLMPQRPKGGIQPLVFRKQRTSLQR